MVKKQGDRLKQYETKSNIIKYILENNGPVGEPDIRRYLYFKYEIKDQSRINRHLHELNKDNYIELIPPTKTGLLNKWNITKFEQLDNIKRKIKDENSFKNISLNEYEKSLMIIYQKRGYNIKTLEGLKTYNRMRLLSSFFNMCMDTDIETLYNRVLDIYLDDNEFKDQYLKKPLNDFYTLFIENNPKAEMSSESFHERMNGLSQEHRDIQNEKTNIISVRNRLVHSDFKLSRYNLLLYYFLHSDRLAGIYSPDAQDFAKKIKENEAIRDELLTESNDQKDREEVTIKWFLGDLKYESELIFKYKQPSIFFKNQKTPDDVYQDLIEFFSFRDFIKHSSVELLS